VRECFFVSRVRESFVSEFVTDSSMGRRCMNGRVGVSSYVEFVSHVYVEFVTDSNISREQGTRCMDGRE